MDEAGAMQDETPTEPFGRAQNQPRSEPVGQPLPLLRPQRRLATTLLVALLAFVLGGAAVAWLVSSGNLPHGLPFATAPEPPAPGPEATGAAPSPAPSAPATDPAALGLVETRLALLEERLTRIDDDATAAAGNAARAEALLIAYAARRRIDKGQPLDFVADQLKLRFGGAQPQAVQTIVAAAQKPITLDELSAQLDAAAPALSGAEREESGWAKLRREVASLFIVRRAPVSGVTPASRVARAQLLLARGEIEQAVAEVERLPGAGRAQDWIEAAQRYGETQRALDVIETAAMLEPRTLRDGAGRTVDQPSPLASPAEAAALPSTTALPSASAASAPAQ